MARFTIFSFNVNVLLRPVRKMDENQRHEFKFLCFAFKELEKIESSRFPIIYLILNIFWKCNFITAFTELYFLDCENSSDKNVRFCENSIMLLLTFH